MESQKLTLKINRFYIFTPTIKLLVDQEILIIHHLPNKTLMYLHRGYIQLTNTKLITRLFNNLQFSLEGPFEILLERNLKPSLKSFHLHHYITLCSNSKAISVSANGTKVNIICLCQWDIYAKKDKVITRKPFSSRAMCYKMPNLDLNKTITMTILISIL